MTYAATKFEVAMSYGLGGDTFTRNMTEGCTDGQQTEFDTTLIYPIILNVKAGIVITQHAKSCEIFLTMRAKS